MAKKTDKPVWIETPAGDLKPGDVVVINVEKGMEWVPGPYGAFVVKSVRRSGDEIRVTAGEAWGGTVEVKLGPYDSGEKVTVRKYE